MRIVDQQKKIHDLEEFLEAKRNKNENRNNFLDIFVT